MTPANQYFVRFVVDGVPRDSNPQSGGEGSWNLFYSGWYATPGSHTVTVTVDAGNTVDEGTFESNNSKSFTFDLEPTDLPARLIAPIAGIQPRLDRCQLL